MVESRLVLGKQQTSTWRQKGRVRKRHFKAAGPGRDADAERSGAEQINEPGHDVGQETSQKLIERQKVSSCDNDLAMVFRARYECQFLGAEGGCQNAVPLRSQVRAGQKR